MQKKDLFQIIDKKYNTLTTSEKIVANYVENNASEVLYLSISDLAAACDVSDATVFRFCKSLDLVGYQEFRMSLAQSLSNGTNLVYSNILGKITKNDSIEELAQKVFTNGIDSLNETLQLLNYSDVLKSVNMISNARLINFFGSGSSAITAMSAMDKFSRIVPNAFCVMDAHIQSMKASLMTENDLAITFSYSGSSKDTIHVVKTAKETGAKTICITRFKRSPITEYSDIVLLCGSKEGPLQGGSLSAKMSQLYIIDVLYNEYFRKHYDKNQLNKERTTKSVSSKLL